ncbi:hypothetical protein POK33_29415 [Burkholderia cenocepacia]|uniref:hypothetical protein n=1 Tax=Burkholderia cenocepacia TaxID=95486 RepID=UPI0023B8E5AC|nr:hypothetical protein [Burkholderia cenocepacia]MDF0504858.1 hypothetical protein [Burkholderia cenocepacia]
MATIDIETKDVTEPRKFVTLKLTEAEAQEVKRALYRPTHTPDDFVDAYQSPIYILLRDVLDGKPKLRPELSGGQAPRRKAWWK